MYCGPDGGTPPDVLPPGGTPECPDDKNREGCPCGTPGVMEACWPGLRANRNRGICRDGVTTCQTWDEFANVWGPCVGYVLPVPGATKGAPACRCFSLGQWAIQNLSPCFVEYGGGGGASAVSTFVDGSGTASCPTGLSSSPPPSPQPGTVWSTDRLTVDCEGQFRLCYTLKAGNAGAPSPADCVVASVCVDVWYAARNTPQDLPPLPAWTGMNPACARSFRDSGGYGEMSVLGRSIECEAVDDGTGAEYVFNRVNYCPIDCPAGGGGRPECQGCMMGGSGNF
jgi:hypothetical protein